MQGRRFSQSDKWIAFAVAVLMTLPIVVPLLMLFTASFMDSVELAETFGAAMGSGQAGEYAELKLLPDYPTLRAYIELLLDSPEFFVMYWNSVAQTVGGIVGQLLFAVPAAWAFARYEFPLKKVLFTLYIVLMIIPFQVTMVGSYLVMNKLSLMDTAWAIILPCAFSAFPVFIMTKFFRSIPKPILEAAQIDGASEWRIFTHIGLRLGMPGIVAIVVLGFLENWSLIEQPLVFLRDKELWPLPLYLPSISTGKAAIAMAAAVITMLPALLIFLLGQNQLEQGIVASGIKE